MRKTFSIIMLALLVCSALSQSVILRNPGCNAYDQQGVCKSCSTRFYKDQNNICQPVNPNCKTYDEKNGDCLSCYPGFGLLEGTCLPGIEDEASLDPNCNQFNDKVCVKCSFGYYFDQNNKCTKANPDCATFNDKNGDCTSCYPSFALSQGKCIRQAAKPVDVNCNQFDTNGNCVKCSSGYYFNVGVCVKIDDSCKDFDLDRKVCKQCYPGYALNAQSKCVQQAPKQNPNPLCAQWNGDVCVKCSKGSVFDSKGMCFLVDAYCRTFDIPTSTCKKCYTGYYLLNGVCKLEDAKSVSDPNCNSFSNGKCTKCSTGFYFNAAKICVKIDDSCKSFSVANSRCMDCYSGYQLSSSGECVVSIQSVTDVNCAQWKGSICEKCSIGASFNANGLCVIRDAQCREYDEKTNKCKACYSGYELNADSTTCVQSAIQQVLDINCAEWKGKVCLRCSFGAAFNNLGKCVILDQQCKEYDSISGLCKLCYSGYQLNTLNICTLKSIEQVADPLCAEWSQDICVRCSPGSFFGSNGKCTQIDTSCKAANSLTGECLECYEGYTLSRDRNCVKNTDDVANTDPNCAEFNGKTCKKCSVGAAFNNFGKCIFLDPQCKQYDQLSTNCKGCYAGYSLDSTFTCVKSDVQDVKDPLCSQWNQDICVRCSFGAFFNSLGVCSQADSSCKTFDGITGKCSTCYTGYAVSLEGTCVKAAVRESQDSNCAEWDPSGELCLRCSTGSFFNGLGLCELVDPLCKTSNMLNGACTSCFSGYALSPIGKCQKSIAPQGDPLCAEFVDSKCTKCSFGAFFNKNGVCQLADSLCSQFNKVTGECTKCYPGHALKEGKCEIDSSYTVSDPFCAEFQNNVCKKCSTGYYFEKDGKCTAADPLCATFSQADGRCLSCFIGYMIQTGLCVPKPEDARDPNCAIFNQDNTCKKCSKGFVFSTKLQNCQLANPLCKTTDQNGACKSCYSGYIISDTTCVLDANAESSFCAEFVEDICVRCASRTFLNSLGQCEKVSEDCRTYNDFTGQCLSCYSGFALKSGKCVKDSVQGGCSEFNGNNQCTKCASGFYLNSKKQCVQVDPQCAKFNFGTNLCEGCYSGYTLLEGRCEVAKVNDQFQVKNCVAYNTDNKCIQCFDRFFLSANQCKDVSVFCKTYDLITGECKTCYTNFKLKNGQCSK